MRLEWEVPSLSGAVRAATGEGTIVCRRRVVYVPRMSRTVLPLHTPALAVLDQPQQGISRLIDDRDCVSQRRGGIC